MAGETTSAILGPVLSFRLQSKVLENLRDSYTYANKAWAEMGTFVPGADIIKWASVPDLAADTTPLTEGTAPTAVALSVDSVSLDSAQYGGLVKLTDLAKLKSPFDVMRIASERLADKQRKTVDQLVRDEVAAGGTPKYANDATSRATVGTNDTVSAATLRKLSAQMTKANIERFADGYFRLVCSPEVEYDLRADTATGGFIDVHKYTTPETIIRGEVGRMEAFRIIVADTAPTVNNGTVDVHLSLGLGKLPGWGWGDLQRLRTYYTAPGGQSDPLHQNELVGYKMDFGTAILDNARFMRLESAGSDLS